MVELSRRLIAAGCVAVLTLAVGCGGGGGAAATSTTRVPTRDEYAQAAADAVRCLEDMGFVASAYEIFDGSFNISVGTPDGDAADNSARIDAAYSACAERHLNEIQAAYLASIRPSEEDARRMSLECLVDIGLIDDIDVPEEELATFDRRYGEDPGYAECLDAPYRDLRLDPDDG